MNPPPHTPSLYASKHDLAIAALRETGVDAWLVFVRETSITGDPALSLLYGGQFTWPTALLFLATGERVAIVGNLDHGPVEASGLFAPVLTYTEGIASALREVLERYDPASIGINFAMDDVLGDGLSHGMLLRLLDALDGTPWGDRLVSAAPIAAIVRGRKSAAELARIQAAIAAGDTIFAEVAKISPIGRSEAEIHRWMQSTAIDRGHGLAWLPAMCPIVNAGGGSVIGHGHPSDDIFLRPGDILHVDFGVKVDGYCSDIQRCWYALDAVETRPPQPVAHAFETVVAAIDAAFDAMRPGVAAWQVDRAARDVLLNAGYPAYPHATGHEVGRFAHDGGAVLGPRWPRYGTAADKKLEVGNVFTLEPSIADVDGRGTIGIEEMVVLEQTGPRWLSTPQRVLWLLPSL